MTGDMGRCHDIGPVAPAQENMTGPTMPERMLLRSLSKKAAWSDWAGWAASPNIGV
jgi:hypothetical protein